MGTARMGADPARSVVAPDGQVHDVRGLYIADASVFPTSLGVNPMITIIATARRIARGLVARTA
jgi:choline dehydrogenase-like flavoprotein